MPVDDQEPIIIARDVNKWYGHFQALKDVNMEVQKGEVVVIFGPSGSGKSTFIRTINRLEEHEQGQICTISKPSAWKPVWSSSSSIFSRT
jgi:ABC-type polar amino acid transport system ATPase subunit